MSFVADRPTPLEDLRQRLPRGWGQRPLPDPADDEVRQVVDGYATAKGDERARLGAHNAREADLLHAYAERMATLAVREHATARLAEAVLALDMAVPAEDWREGLITLAMVNHGAELLGTTLSDVGKDLEDHLSDLMLKRLLDFEQRQPQEKSLEAFLFHTEGTGDQFRFVPGRS